MDLTEQRVPHLKTEHSKVFRDADGSVQLTVGKKEFTHVDYTVFKQDWMREFDRELEPIGELLVEFSINFPPSYPYEENPDLPHHYMSTR
jgi:inositol polyphosphate 5-phosphatase INPP5A